MKNFKSLLIGAPLALAVLAACGSPGNPQLGQAGEADQIYKANSGETQAAKVPQVDILFVVDDSDSMKKHLANVQANMATFANQFSESANVMYHVGLVKVFDSTRYGVSVKNFVQNGELQNDSLDTQLVTSLLAKTPAATAADQSALIENTPQWIDRSTDSELNKASLTKLLTLKTKSIADGGPNKEEIFSPIVSAVTDPAMSSGRNKGFIRQDANLAVIILTDAEDSSPAFMNAADAYDKSKVSMVKDLLDRAKGGDASKISMYAALAGKEADGTNCTMDVDNQQPDKIKALIEMYHGESAASHIFNLCSSKFTATMQKIGTDINLRAHVDTVIPLPAPLDENELKSVEVRYGTSEDKATLLPAGTWQYVQATNVIAVTAPPLGQAGARFYVKYLGMSANELIRRQKLARQTR